MTEQELEVVRYKAVESLDAAALKLQQRLEFGPIHKLAWEPYEWGLQAKVGRGYLQVSRQPPPGYPGINYVSSQGPNSDNSYGGFLPGVTFEEALLLVYGDYQRYTK